MEAMRILLVAGGWSTEREISLIGARAIERTLAALGHHVTLFDLKDGFEPLLELARSHDAAFLNLHGQPGEDGLVQALLDRAGCPYQGAGPAGSFLALNKAAAKALFLQRCFHQQAGLFRPSVSGRRIADRVYHSDPLPDAPAVRGLFHCIFFFLLVKRKSA